MSRQLHKDNNQSPITKLQLITNTQYPNKKFQKFTFGDSVIGYWVLIGYWCLVIGDSCYPCLDSKGIYYA